MMSIRSLADFNGSSPGRRCGDGWHRHRHRPGPQLPADTTNEGAGTFNWPPATTCTWPHTWTFSEVVFGLPPMWRPTAMVEHLFIYQRGNRCAAVGALPRRRAHTDRK